MKILFPYLARWDTANRSRYHQLLTQLCLVGHEVYVLKSPQMTVGDLSFTDLEGVIDSAVTGLTISEFEVPPALRKFIQTQIPKSKLLKKGLLSLTSVDQVRRFVAEEAIDLLMVYNLPQVRLLEQAECHKHFDLADDLIAMLAVESGLVGKAGALAAARYTQARMLELADTVTVASSVLAEQIERPTLMLPNGADLVALDQADGREWSATHSGQWVGFVGAFEYWVDFELVLRVARRMRHVNFLLVGGGRLFPLINQAVERSGMKNVFLTGALPYDQAMNHMAAMDVCLIPFTQADAVSDGSCPLKLFEYAALRKPIVSTPITEVERLGKGWVSFGYDAADFADAIEHFLADPQHAAEAGAIGRDQVEQIYNWPKLAEQFMHMVSHQELTVDVGTLSRSQTAESVGLKR